MREQQIPSRANKYLFDTRTFEIRLKPKEAGAWIELNNRVIGLTIRPRIQHFHVHSDASTSSVLAFWQYKAMIKLICDAARIKTTELSIASIRQLIQLHDSLIEAHIPTNVWMLLKAQYKATGGYAAHPPEVLSKLSVHAFKDIQTFKFASALLRDLCSYKEGTKFIFDGQSISLDKLIPQEMDNWRGILAPERKAYRALNKTMNDWRGKVPNGIAELKHYKLEKALYPEQVRLLLVLFDVLNGAFADEMKISENGHERPVTYSEIIQHWAHIIQNVPLSEIRMLLNLPIFRQHNRGRGNNRGNPYRELLSYLKDGAVMLGNPFIHHNSLYFMWRAAHEAHEERRRQNDAQRNAARQLELASRQQRMDTKTAPLKHEIPEYEDGSIRFLATVAECYEEEDLMENCVGWAYSANAVAGNCYLFHIEHKGFMASAELAPNGMLRQINGVDNRKNPACDWGRQKLQEWVRTAW